MGRLGLLGGTFDPPHIGHLILAEVLADALRLDAVWFVPAADPPHKQGQLLTPAAHRVAMVRLAIADNPRFVLSHLDVSRPGPHYSADLIALVRESQPDADLFFLMGGDSLRDLPVWHDPARLLRLCRLGVLNRPGAVIDMAALAVDLPGIEARVQIVDGPSIAVSASVLRERLRRGQSVRYLIPDAVADYIAAAGLYAPEA